MISLTLLNGDRKAIIKFTKKRSWIYDKPATIPSGGFWVSSLTQKEINIRIYMYTDLELQYSA